MNTVLQMDLPGILFAANLNASLITCSCNSPFNSKIIRLTAILLAQKSKLPFPVPIRHSFPLVYTPMFAQTRV